jgi:hypothetical protein
VNWRAWVELNHRPRPYQRIVVRFYNNPQDHGDCQITRKSCKKWVFVGWVLGWQKSTTSEAFPRHFPEPQCAVARSLAVLPVVPRNEKRIVIQRERRCRLKRGLRRQTEFLRIAVSVCEGGFVPIPLARFLRHLRSHGPKSKLRHGGKQE